MTPLTPRGLSAVATRQPRSGPDPVADLSGQRGLHARRTRDMRMLRPENRQRASGRPGLDTIGPHGKTDGHAHRNGTALPIPRGRAHQPHHVTKD